MEQPKAFAWKIFQKALVLFNRFEAGDHYHIGFLSDFIRFFKFPFLSLWLILPFSMAGMLMSLKESKTSRCILLIILVYASTLMIFFTNARFRLPFLVIFIPFAVVGTVDILKNIKEGKLNNTIKYIMILVFFFIIEFLPVRATNDMTAYLNTHGIILNSRGFEKEAIEYWQKSSGVGKHYSDFANISLAGQYVRNGDFQKALNYLNYISDNSFAASNKYELMGDIRLRQGRIEESVKAYEKSLEINYGRNEVREKLIKIYWRKERKKALQEYDRHEYILSFYQ
jgi:hypothetical protein